MSSQVFLVARVSASLNSIARPASHEDLVANDDGTGRARPGESNLPLEIRVRAPFHRSRLSCRADASTIWSSETDPVGVNRRTHREDRGQREYQEESVHFHSLTQSSCQSLANCKRDSLGFIHRQKPNSLIRRVSSSLMPHIFRLTASRRRLRRLRKTVACGLPLNETAESVARGGLRCGSTSRQFDVRLRHAIGMPGRWSSTHS